MVTFWYQRSRAHHAYASRCEWRTPFRPCASVSRKYSLRSMPADQAVPSPVSTSTHRSSRNSRSLMTRSICRLSFGLMQLRFSGRLNFTQAIPSLTRTATVSASARWLMSRLSGHQRTTSGTIAILYSSVAHPRLRCQLPRARIKDPLVKLSGYLLRRASTAAVPELNERLRPPGLRPAGGALPLLVQSSPRPPPSPPGAGPAHPPAHHGPSSPPP